MANRSIIAIGAFLAGAAVVLVPDISTRLHRTVGSAPGNAPTQVNGTFGQAEPKMPVVAMDDDRIKLAHIELTTVGPGMIARCLER